jgi:vacuolar protein sorting-associated protein 52
MFFQYPFEALFRSLHYALLDNSCLEYLFVSDFFMVSSTAAHDFFNMIFGKTVAMFMVSLLHCRFHQLLGMC